MALSDNLVSYWSLDEASGDALDAHGSNDLTQSGSVATAAGKVGNARSFAAADTEYFSKADNADLSVGDTDVTFACWIKINSMSGFPVISSKGWQGSPDANSEFAFYYDVGVGALTLGYCSGTSANVIRATTFGALTAGVWYFVAFWHDSVNNVLGISVNGTADTASYSSGINDGNRAFELGANVASSLYWDGLIDEAGFWRRVLSGTERAQLYNSGNGLSYSEVNPPSIAVTSPISSDRRLVGVAENITWNSSNVDNIDILLSLDGGTSYTVTIATAITNTGSYSYTPPDNTVVTATAKIKVRSSADALVFAESAAFKIATTEPGSSLFTGVIA